jgi:D-alanyl-D-alanine dipeptidase
MIWKIRWQISFKLISKVVFLYLASAFHPTAAQWVDIESLDSTILLDIRYAHDQNFSEEQLYPCARCMLRPKTGAGLLRAHKMLVKEGYYIKVFDCYRPLPVQQKLWNKFPDPSYVTPPWKGSNHNRGMAVDVGLTDSCGIELDMGTGFDHLGRKSNHDFSDLPKEVLHRRQKLRAAMEVAGFSAIRTEWWHYNYYQEKHPLDSFIWNCTDY